MLKLNLPEYTFKIRKANEKVMIFDPFRRKYITLSPEEWVRQNFAMYLTHEKSYPESLIAIEYELRLNRLSKRCDILVFSKSGNPKVLVECKSPNISVAQKTIDQAARYNSELRVEYMIFTNGMNHYCCKIDFETLTYSFLEHIPDYNNL